MSKTAVTTTRKNATPKLKDAALAKIKGDAPAKRGPGRPRKNKVEAPTPAPVEVAAPAPAPIVAAPAKTVKARGVPKRGNLTHDDVAPRAARINRVTHCVVCGRYLKLHLNGLYRVDIGDHSYHVGPTCATRLPGTYLVKSFPKGWEKHAEIVEAVDAKAAWEAAERIFAPAPAAPAPEPTPAPEPVKAEPTKRGPGRPRKAITKAEQTAKKPRARKAKAAEVTA